MHQQARSRLERVGHESSTCLPRNLNVKEHFVHVYRTMVNAFLANASDSAIDCADESDVDEERCE